jgi:XTP/dITP diphosphohydrolase
MTLCFATNNHHKLNEVGRLLGEPFRVLTLKEAGCEEELEEDQDTLEGNSLQKAKYVYDKIRLPTFADDSGLMVEVLNGAPGVYSARYAGPQRRDQDNIALLLKNLDGEAHRRAFFKTVVTLVNHDGIHQFEGSVQGTILRANRGTGGFGYDPVFVPDGHTVTFAEMSGAEKNEISHRSIAVNKLVHFLQSNYPVDSPHA